MSCQKTANQAARVAKQNGITGQASKVGQALAGKRLKRIVIQPNQEDGLAISIRQGGQNFYGREVKIEGPSLVISNPDKPLSDGITVWIETRSPVKVLLDELGKGNKEKKEKEKSPAQPALSGRAKRVKADRAAKAASVKQFHQAIQQKRKVSVRYRSPKGMRKYILVPLDVKAGRTGQARKNKYMWGYSENAQAPISLRLDRVLAVKQLDEASFDPADLAKVWEGKKVEWSLPRDW
jgi:hypothetical protein